MIKVETDKAPAAIGPYSQAVKAGDFLFASGMLPVDPATSQMAEADIKVQTEQVFKNIKALLEHEGLKMSDIAKTTVFLKDMNDFAAMNEVYKSAFSGCSTMPARSAVQVARLPKDSMIEIEVIALLKK